VIQRWRRRTGVIYRPWTIWSEARPGSRMNWSNDGGDDAPLSHRGRLVFRGVLVFVVASGIVLIVASRPG
jgi:hypothetical protein